jgi:NAD(P)-dependent dehydrogenase (short-subunit alcohol dehydrogenase family)
MLLENKTAVIYAAGGAIGGAVARAFAREGATLFLTGRNLANVESVATEIVAAGGVAEAAEVDALDEEAVAHHGDGRGPAHERPGLRCDRDADSPSRPGAREQDRGPSAGLGCRRGVLAFASPRGGTGRDPGGLPAFTRDSGDPLIEENFATAGKAFGVSAAQFRAGLEQTTLLKRLPALAEVADTAAFVVSDGAGAMTATVVNLSGGGFTD